MGNYIYKKGTVQPLTIDITPDVTSNTDITNIEEQVTTASESLKEQIKRIEENNYTSPTITVTHIPIPIITTIHHNKRFDFENKGRPNQLLSNFSNDISAALQNKDSNKVCAKTPKNSPRVHDTTSIEKYKNDASDASDASDDEDIPGEESALEMVDKKVVNRTSCGLCDSLDKQEEENAFKEFYKMMRDIML